MSFVFYPQALNLKVFQTSGYGAVLSECGPIDLEYRNRDVWISIKVAQWCMKIKVTDLPLIANSLS